MLRSDSFRLSAVDSLLGSFREGCACVCTICGTFQAAETERCCMCGDRKFRVSTRPDVVRAANASNLRTIFAIPENKSFLSVPDTRIAIAYQVQSKELLEALRNIHRRFASSKRNIDKRIAAKAERLLATLEKSP